MEQSADRAIELRKAVGEGKISEEDARARLAGMRKMMGDQGERKHEGADRKRPDWEGIKKRIEGAVKSGKMTREEADVKYKEIKKRMAGRRER